MLTVPAAIGLDPAIILPAEFLAEPQHLADDLETPAVGKLRSSVWQLQRHSSDGRQADRNKLPDGNGY